MKHVVLIIFLLSSMGVFAQSNKELNQKINALAQEVERVTQRYSAPRSGGKVGGYGEFHYVKEVENTDQENSDPENNPEFDNKRFIIYVGYDFSPKWRLMSETEVEHADEIYIEQAFLENKLDDNSVLQFGTLLIPMGHTNLLHEPITFLPVQRPKTETRIIPSTWRENGVTYIYDSANYYIQLFAVNGLATSNNGKVLGASGFRSGRQKASKTNATDGAYGVRFDKKLNSSTELGLAWYHTTLSFEEHEDLAQANIWDLHFKQVWKGLQYKLLYVLAKVDGVESFNETLNTNLARKMDGGYIELGYDINFGRTQEQIIPFIRIEVLDTQAEVDKSKSKDQTQQESDITLGIAYKPVPRIVFKADYTQSRNLADGGNNSFNLGMGWSF